MLVPTTRGSSLRLAVPELIATLALVGCTGTPAPPAVQAADLGWATRVVTEPSAFEALMDSSPRDGWTALHAHETRAAAAAFAAGGAGAPDSVGPAQAGYVRAWVAEAVLQEDLQRLNGLAADRLFTAWAERGSLPAEASLVATLAAQCSGLDASRWAQTLPDDARARLLDRGGAAPDDPSGRVDAVPDSVEDRLDLHARVRGGAPATALIDAAPTPILSVAKDGITRDWFDPCVHRTLADEARSHLGTDAQAALARLPEAGLASSLFAPWLDADDLAEQLDASTDLRDLGGYSPRIEQSLGLPRAPATTDDSQSAREEVRALDLRLDATRIALDAQADADGAALLNQVGVVDRLRQEVLVARARRDLRAGNHRRALATLLLARDVTDRTIGPRNSPALMTLLAEANLRAGRSRESLDALQLLAGRRPEVLGLRELVGDLSVLQGLDRHGDSKEH